MYNMLKRNKQHFLALCNFKMCPCCFVSFPGAAYSILQGWSHDADVTVELLRRRRWLLMEPLPMETNKASQDGLKLESQDSPGILADDDADNSSQIMVTMNL